MHLFYTPDIATTLELPQEEAAHALRVLRLTEGDEVMLTDGKGSFYRAEIDMISGKRCYVRIVETTTPEPETTKPEETKPADPVPTGDSALIFAVVAVISILGVAVVAKRREN